MYGGAIGSRGPRYCPSVEDKIVKFPHAERHQLFLEPEGHDTTELYVNGLSTSLPGRRAARDPAHVPGLENVADDARRVRDRVRLLSVPTQLDSTLEVKSASRVCSSPARSTERPDTRKRPVRAWSPASTRRVGARAARRWFSDARRRIIGVLVDDLVTRGVDEPYRLFTSRSEFRLTVRQDNALRRLAAIARDAGLLRRERSRGRRCTARPGGAYRRAGTARPASAWTPRIQSSRRLAKPRWRMPCASAELAKRPGCLSWRCWQAAGVPCREPGCCRLTAELELKYAGYFERERAQAERLRRLRDFALPEDLPYPELRSLSTEARQKLAALRPGDAGAGGERPGRECIGYSEPRDRSRATSAGDGKRRGLVSHCY